jgi:hypothetical protein
MSVIDFTADLPTLLASGRLVGEVETLRRAAETLPAADYGAVAVTDEAQARVWLAWAGAKGWQPVRIALDRETRSRGFPEVGADFQKMREWCRKACRRGWAVEALTATLRDPEDAALTFWFEDGAEARGFMLKWMPLRCT